MDTLGNYIIGGSLAAYLGYFLWWKKQLHRELVEPDVKLIEKDVERINARLDKLEHKTENLPASIDSKINDITKEITEIKELLATLNGKFEVYLSDRK